MHHAKLLKAGHSRILPLFIKISLLFEIMASKKFLTLKNLSIPKLSNFSMLTCPCRWRWSRHSVIRSWNSDRVQSWTSLSDPNLPNEGDHCYLKAYDDLLAYGRTEAEVYLPLPNPVESPKLPPIWKQSCRVISKWFIENVVARGGQTTLCIPSSLFLYSLQTNCRLNIGYIICTPPSKQFMAPLLLVLRCCRSLTGCF